MLKKRTLCTMMNEHREYKVQDLPLERMNCVGKNMEMMSGSEAVERRGHCMVVVPSILALLMITGL